MMNFFGPSGRWKNLLLGAVLVSGFVCGCASAPKTAPPITPPPDETFEDQGDEQFVGDPLSPSVPVALSAQASSHSVLKTAFSQIGKAYRYGGTSPETGFDCSGFVRWVYGQFDVKLPRRSGDMMAVGTAVDRKNLKPGDLVFFGRKKTVTHVGIYSGDGKYIHSPRTGKPVQESDLDDRGRGEYYVGARRLLPAARLAEVTAGQKKTWSGGRLVATAKKAPEKAPARAAASPADPPKVKTHKVGSGDTLYGLAKKYKVNIDVLARMNKISDPQKAVLRPGQTILVPEGQLRADLNSAAAPTSAQTASAAAAAPEPAAPKAAPAGGRHKIVDGDTFYGVAIKYGVKYADLAAANNISDINSYVLKPGRTMIIPPASGGSGGREAKSQKHTVTAGETFYGIAKKYGVKSADLASANNIKDIQKVVLRPGQALIIPGKK